MFLLFFERAAGVKMTHVPYKGSAEVRTGLLTGQLVVGAINVGEALQYMQGGASIRMLGQMSLKRTNLAPDTPTFAEQGFQMESASLRGLAAPKGLPADIREKLVKAVAHNSRNNSIRKINFDSFCNRTIVFEEHYCLSQLLIRGQGSRTVTEIAIWSTKCI